MPATPVTDAMKLKEAQQRIEELEAQKKALEEKASQPQQKDHVQGKLVRAKKRDGSDAKFFKLIMYQVGKDEEPIQDGVTKIGDREFPKYKLMRVFRVAESSLLKVASGEAKSCNIYWSQKP